MSAGAAERPARCRLRRSPARLCAALLLGVGLLAPFLANDVPLVARVDGAWSFPALTVACGGLAPGPADLTWKQWWSRLPADGADLAVMPPWPHGPDETDPGRFGAGPSFAHPLGNDGAGHDLLARLVHGASAVLSIGGVAVLIAALVGTVLGALAGFCRGLVDVVVLRLVEVFLCFPGLVLLLFAGSLFGDSRLGLIAVMAALFWVSFARIVRGELLSLRERDFVLVARQLGVGPWRVLLRHLLPQVRSQIAVTAAFCMAAAIVAESTLSFLGIGPGRALCSWGHVLRLGSEAAATGGWHQWLFPAAVIVAAVGCCHALADQFRARRA